MVEQKPKIETEKEKSITLTEILGDDTVEDMCIEDGYITDITDYITDGYELINVKEDDNMIIENSNEEETINLKKKSKKDIEIKMQPEKFITNDALNIQHIDSYVKKTENPSEEVEIISIYPLHPRDRLARKTKKDEVKITKIFPMHPRG